LPLLRQRRVVDDQKTSLIADQAIGLLQQGRLERNAIPHPGSDKMMKLIIADVTNPRGHRLDALTLARPDQAGDVERTHPAPRRMR
jgi:DNA-binding TFAR19-related protein (PDSD5 family)